MTMGDVALTYLVSHPTSVSLGVESPFVLLLLALAALFVVVPIRFGTRRVTSLRFASFAFVISSLAGLSLKVALPANDLSIVAAVDVSPSISDAAVTWSKTYLKAIRSALAPGDQLAILTFAREPDIVTTKATDADVDGMHRPADATGTNIAAAIDRALALYPPESQKALLLLSDGNETSGDSRSRVDTLRALGVRLSTASPPRDPSAAPRIARLTAPVIVGPERPVPLRVSVRNPSAPHAALLNLYLDNRISDSVAVDLGTGLDTFDLLLRVPEPGGHVIRAEILVDGVLPAAAASREVSVTVRSGTRVLLATNRRHSSLAEALAARGVLVETIAPAQLPATVDGYSSVHLVILEELRGRDVRAQAASALEQFVRLSGGGVIFVGGGASYGDRAFQGTGIQQILPVTLEPHRPRPGKRDPLALFLVIDRSNSMGFNSRIGTVRDGEKLRYAIKAGMTVVKQLKDHDQVGVIAFDAQPHEIAALRPLKINREQLLTALPRIVESGGTDFFDALASAGKQLAVSRVTRKHVVLLTDGDTNRADRGEYRALIRELANAGISVTTVRIGDNTVNLKLLQEISKGTGGSFHYVENVQMLPELMLRDTSRALQPAPADTERYFPSIAMKHHLLEGTTEGEIPQLRDYAFSKARPSSETLLHVVRADRRDPILNVWRYGLGRVAAFTASPSEDAESWPAWAGFSRFWSQLTFWTARRESERDLVVEAIRHDDQTVLTVHTFGNRSADGSVSAVLAAGDVSIEVDFTAVGPTEYEARLQPLSPGRYPLRVRLRQERSLYEVDTAVAVPARIHEEVDEFDHDGDNEQLLRQLTVQTGGTFSATTREVTDRPPGSRNAPYPLDGLLIPLAIAAFFTDIALRRLAALRNQPT
jgi:Mg-chelatase subunit ChlD